MRIILALCFSSLLCAYNLVTAQGQRQPLDYIYGNAAVPIPIYKYVYADFEQIANDYGGANYALFGSPKEQKLLATHKVSQIKEIWTWKAGQSHIRLASYNANGQCTEHLSGSDTSSWGYDQQNRLVSYTRASSKTKEITQIERQNNYLHISQISYAFAVPQWTSSKYFNKDSVFYVDSFSAYDFEELRYGYMRRGSVKMGLLGNAKLHRLEWDSNTKTEETELVNIVYNEMGLIDATSCTNSLKNLPTVSKHYYNTKKQLIKKTCTHLDHQKSNATIHFSYRKNGALKKEVLILEFGGSNEFIQQIAPGCAYQKYIRLYNKKGFPKKQTHQYLSAKHKVLQSGVDRYYYNKKGFLTKLKMPHQSFTYKYIFSS